jgi:hypothetical protein
MIHPGSHRCEGKGRIVLVYADPEHFVQRAAALQEAGENGWWLREGRELDLALKTTHAKARVNVGGGCQFLRHKVKSMTMCAFKVLGT